MKKSIQVLGIGSLLALSAVVPASAQQATAPADPVIYLNQAWSQADREMYYQIVQGSSVLDYDIFLNLELANSQELFRSDANSERYGLIPQAANPRTNPDALPIGLAKTVNTDGRWKGEYVGVTCAACHNTQLTYKGKGIRIDGASNNNLDFMAYIITFDDALQATLTDPSKFDRLAGRLGASSPDAKSALRKRFEWGAARVHHYRTVNLATPYPWGPARMDAIALIINRLESNEPDIPENWSPPLAPTKPPFLWNAPQGSWTQWRGSQQDPIKRNLGEVDGVYMFMDLRSKTPEEGLFDSNAHLRNLEKIEELLNRLAPPKWPEDLFGKIDQQKALQGKELFAEHCTKCHNSYPYTWTKPNKYGKRWIQVGLVPQSHVGTDPGQFEDLLPFAMTKQLAPYVLGPFKDKPIVPTGVLYVSIQERLDAAALAKLKLTEAERIKINGYREFPLPKPPYRVYKAAPRDGVWATPPFMHNASVPNLYEMLVPASERTKKFYVGREFDPVKVGVDTSGTTGFLMDTSLRGNTNVGHSFEDGPVGNGIIGPKLDDEQRWALVEYLKSIPGEAGRVTPFGGPPNAVTGNPPFANPPPR
jgi:cytochrome c peroxidase